MSQPPEPAEICYTLGKGWPDCHRVFQRTMAKIGPAANRYFAKFTWDENWPSFPFRLGGTLGVSVGGILLSIAGYVLQLTLLSIIASCRLVLTAIFWTLEWGWRGYWRVFSICDDCGHSSSLPAYLCDGCGAMHRALVPNHFGIFSHRCNVCDRAMRSSVFSGRHRHAACCPIDGYPITNFGLTPVVIAFGGGPSSGKTNLLCRSLASLIRHRGPAGKWKLEWQDGDDGRFAVLEAQHRQDAIHSTPNEVPRAFRLRLNDGQMVDRLLRVYDPGGEAFHCSDSLEVHAYYSRLAGAVFVFDPFALSSVQQLVGQTTESLSDLRPAQSNVQSCFERLLDAPGVSMNTRTSSAVLAIVITKMDAHGLLSHLRGAYPGLTDHDAGQAFLMEHGMAALISQAKSHFRSVRIFFGGRFPKTENEPDRDDAAPLLWVIEQASCRVKT